MYHTVSPTVEWAMFPVLQLQIHIKDFHQVFTEILGNALYSLQFPGKFSGHNLVLIKKKIGSKHLLL